MPVYEWVFGLTRPALEHTAYHSGVLLAEELTADLHHKFTQRNPTQNGMTCITELSEPKRRWRLPRRANITSNPYNRNKRFLTRDAATHKRKYKIMRRKHPIQIHLIGLVQPSSWYRRCCPVNNRSPYSDRVTIL